MLNRYKLFDLESLFILFFEVVFTREFFMLLNNIWFNSFS